MGDLRRILIDLSGLSDDSYSEMSIKINQMLEERGKVSDAFDTVLRAMFRINGGVGSLGEAADNVDSRRTKTDAASEAAMEAAHRFVATFVKHTKERDRMVAKRSLASETREANAYARDRVENGSLLERVMAANMLGGSRASDTTGLRAVEAGDFTARNPKEGLMQIGLVAGSGLLILFGGEFLMAGGATVLRVAAMNFGSKLLTSSLKLGSRFLASTSKYSLLTYFRAMAVKVGIQNLLREAATSALAWGMRVSASNTMRLIMSAYKGGVALGAISGTVNLLSGLCSGESWEQIARRTSDGASAGFLSGFSWGGAAAAQSAILAIVGKLITSLGSDIAVNLNRGGDFDTDFWVQSGGHSRVGRRSSRCGKMGGAQALRGNCDPKGDRAENAFAVLLSRQIQLSRQYQGIVKGDGLRHLPYGKIHFFRSGGQVDHENHIFQDEIHVQHCRKHDVVFVVQRHDEQSRKAHWHPRAVARRRGGQRHF